jgi:hypothetical protein
VLRLRLRDEGLLCALNAAAGIAAVQGQVCVATWQLHLLQQLPRVLLWQR